MVTPQINIRVPAHLHPLIKRMGELLRLRPDLGERIAAVVEELEAEAGAEEAGSGSRERPALESGAARLEALEATVEALARRLDALEPAAVPEAPKPRRPSRNSKLGVIARKAGLPAS